MSFWGIEADSTSELRNVPIQRPEFDSIHPLHSIAGTYEEVQVDRTRIWPRPKDSRSSCTRSPECLYPTIAESREGDSSAKTWPPNRLRAVSIRLPSAPLRLHPDLGAHPGDPIAALGLVWTSSPTPLHDGSTKSRRTQ